MKWRRERKKWKRDQIQNHIVRFSCNETSDRGRRRHAQRYLARSYRVRSRENRGSRRSRELGSGVEDGGDRTAAGAKVVVRAPAVMRARITSRSCSRRGHDGGRGSISLGNRNGDGVDGLVRNVRRRDGCWRSFGRCSLYGRTLDA